MMRMNNEETAQEIMREELRVKDAIIDQKKDVIHQRDTIIRRKEEEIQDHIRIIDQKNATVQQMGTTLQEKNTALQEKDAALQEKNTALQEKDAALQEKDAALQEKDTAILQKNDEIQRLQNVITERDGLIGRHETTITEQRRQIARNHDNPHWLIQKEEIQMTQEVLGTGGWGVVKVGVFRGTRVAVKCLHELILSNYNLRLFSREMDVASHIRHPNLLQFIGATRVGNPLIITELMPMSLRRELEICPMTRPQVISIGIDICSALNYLHLWQPSPILHRDISSANVLLEPSGNGNWKAKVADYGSVNLLDNIRTANPGAAVYSAPEAGTPTNHSPAMDIYSFAVLMVEMSTGQFPASVSHEREGQIQDVRWPTVKSLIIRCTANNPLSRPTTSHVLELLRNMN